MKEENFIYLNRKQLNILEEYNINLITKGSKVIIEIPFLGKADSICLFNKLVKVKTQ
ncbi:hypothetical protein LCGC14_2283960 [marine sediment metagenome]|uniref:Uncharacterized protein n=1 Tax=marine sediment metagenome TaxID=412755 RepID=A0A0F9CT30_9ZZZZ